MSEDNSMSGVCCFSLRAKRKQKVKIVYLSVFHGWLSCQHQTPGFVSTTAPASLHFLSRTRVRSRESIVFTKSSGAVLVFLKNVHIARDIGILQQYNPYFTNILKSHFITNFLNANTFCLNGTKV